MPRPQRRPLLYHELARRAARLPIQLQRLPSALTPGAAAAAASALATASEPAAASAVAAARTVATPRLAAATSCSAASAQRLVGLAGGAARQHAAARARLTASIVGRLSGRRWA